jgi:pyruvate dehydrogenase E2 component (dihydrolipoamide acetyltransferase)
MMATTSTTMRASSTLTPRPLPSATAKISKKNPIFFISARGFASGALPEGAAELTMPALSPTMEVGTIAVWEKKVGDKIIVGDILAQIETDKATIAFEATEVGYVGKIFVPAGTKDVKVGTPVILIVENQEDVAKCANISPSTGNSAAPAPAAARPAAAAAAAPAAAAPAPARAAPATTTPAAAAAAAAPRGGDARVVASPAARALADAAKVSLSAVRGTGPQGRIVLADVVEQMAATGATISPGPSAAAGFSAAAAGSFEDIPNSNVRKVIASRLLEAKQSIPHFYLTVDVSLDRLIALREQVNERAAKSGGAKVSLNDFVVKASAMALRAVPEVNSQWGAEAIRRFADVDISVAVDTPHGLTTPIVRGADRRGVAEISATVRELAEKARNKKLVPSDYQGGTFSISNLGMFGVKSFCAIINPPQACILAVGAARDEVIVRPNGQGFATGKVMSVTLSCDHRVVDGAVGAKWLQKFKDNIEDPINMIL